MNKISVRLGRRLHYWMQRGDNVPSDFTRCYVQFLFEAQRAGF